MTSKQKFKKVMHEWKQGKLLIHGKPVTDQKQAIRIAFEEARKINPQFEGGGKLKPGERGYEYKGFFNEEDALILATKIGGTTQEYETNIPGLGKVMRWKVIEGNKLQDGGKLDVIYKKGTSKQLWNDGWDEKQRAHFLQDHLHVYLEIINENTKQSAEKFSKMDYDQLPATIQKEITVHHIMGIYDSGGKIKTDRDIPYNEVLDYADKKGLNTDTEGNLDEARIMLFYEKYKNKKPIRLTPAKRKLQEKIDKLKKAQGKVKTASAIAAIQKRIDKLQNEFDYNPTLKEKIAATRGTFFIEVPTAYSKAIYKKLWNQGIKSKLYNLNGKTKIVVNNTHKLQKAYKAYGDILKEKSITVPALSSIQGSL